MSETAQNKVSLECLLKFNNIYFSVSFFLHQLQANILVYKYQQSKYTVCVCSYSYSYCYAICAGQEVI